MKMDHYYRYDEIVEALQGFVREYPIYKLVKKYSDYIRFPIRMLMPQPRKRKDTRDGVSSESRRASP